MRSHLLNFNDYIRKDKGEHKNPENIGFSPYKKLAGK